MFAAGGLARATINARDSGGNVKGVGAGATFFVFLFTAIFGATWLTVPWLYPAEIFPLEVRARGNAWGVVGWSIGNGWTVSISPCLLVDNSPADEKSRCYFFPPSLKNSAKRRFTSSAP